VSSEICERKKAEITIIICCFRCANISDILIIYIHIYKQHWPLELISFLDLLGVLSYKLQVFSSRIVEYST
jgi:hypothetical protein